MITESLGCQCFWHIYQACRSLDVKRYTPAELQGHLIQRLRRFPALAAQIAALGFAGMRELHHHLRLRQAAAPTGTGDTTGSLPLRPPVSTAFQALRATEACSALPPARTERGRQAPGQRR